MKKSIVLAAIVLGSFSTFATTNLSISNAMVGVPSIQEEYTEVKIEEIPEVIKVALKKAYPDAILNKAYVNEKKEYKLEVTVGEKVGSLYADATGAWIKK